VIRKQSPLLPCSPAPSLPCSVAPLLPAFDPSLRTTHNLLMSRFTDWIPEMVRKEPERTISLFYQVPAGAPPVDIERRITETLHASSLTATPESDSRWTTSLPWQTRVFGLIPRDVDEDLTLRLVQHPDLWEFEVSCRPVETHSAHATGAAAVLFIAVSVWIATGLATGLVAALTTVLAGGLVVEVTRQWAFDALERRLRRLAGDIGSALWPGRPAQIVEAD